MTRRTIPLVADSNGITLRGVAMPRYLARPLAVESGAGVELVDRRSGKRFEGRSATPDRDAALRAAIAAGKLSPSIADGREVEWDAGPDAWPSANDV